MRFENMSKEWGLDQLSFSAGAAFADLDNDGDLDYIINNTNDKAFVYENRSEKVLKNNFLNIRFHGSDQNKNGIGASAECILFTMEKSKQRKTSPYRGYLSSMDATLHFGLGKVATIDSIRIKWPGGKEQMLLHPPINQVINCRYPASVFIPDIKYPFILDSSQISLIV